MYSITFDVLFSMAIDTSFVSYGRHRSSNGAARPPRAYRVSPRQPPGAPFPSILCLDAADQLYGMTVRRRDTTYNRCRGEFDFQCDLFLQRSGSSDIATL